MLSSIDLKLSLGPTHALGILVVVATAGLLATVLRNRYNPKANYRLPNLVPGLPIFGNIFQIPREDPYLHMEKLSQHYGDMFTLRIGGSYWLFLNSQRVVSDLLEKRAAIYSSRMNLPMASDLVSGGKRTLILPYGDLWRRERKVMHQILNNKQISTFEPYQDMESRALLYGYLRKPDDWWKAHTAFSSSVIMSVAFGRRAGLDDPNVRAAMGVAAEFVVFLAPGAALVDIFPFLVKIPWFKSLQPWRWYGDDLYRRTTE